MLGTVGRDKTTNGSPHRWMGNRFRDREGGRRGGLPLSESRSSRWLGGFSQKVGQGLRKILLPQSPGVFPFLLHVTQGGALFPQHPGNFPVPGQDVQVAGLGGHGELRSEERRRGEEEGWRRSN